MDSRRYRITAKVVRQGLGTGGDCVLRRQLTRGFVSVHRFRPVRGVNGQSPLPDYSQGGSPGGWARVATAFAAVAHQRLRDCALVSADQECKRTVAEGVDSPSQARLARLRYLPISAILEVPIILDAPLAHDFPVTIY